jgi:hypothetical protein
MRISFLKALTHNYRKNWDDKTVVLYWSFFASHSTSRFLHIVLNLSKYVSFVLEFLVGRV